MRKSYSNRINVIWNWEENIYCVGKKIFTVKNNLKMRKTQFQIDKKPWNLERKIINDDKKIIYFWERIFAVKKNKLKLRKNYLRVRKNNIGRSYHLLFHSAMRWHRIITRFELYMETLLSLFSTKTVNKKGCFYFVCL